MTRKRRRGGRGRQNSAGPPGERLEVVSGHQLFINTTNGSVVTIPLVPTAFTRAAAIADNFQYYRFTKVKIVVLPSIEPVSSGVQGTNSMAVGYLPGRDPDNALTTEAAVLALPFTTYYSNGSTVPTSLTIPKKELVQNTPLKWWKTIVGNPDAEFEQQGNIYTFYALNGAPSVAVGVNFYIHYTMELQGWVLASNTPLPVPRDIGRLAEHLVKVRQRHTGKYDDKDILEVAGIKYLRISA